MSIIQHIAKGTLRREYTAKLVDALLRGEDLMVRPRLDNGPSDTFHQLQVLSVTAAGTQTPIFTITLPTFMTMQDWADTKKRHKKSLNLQEAIALVEAFYT